MTEAECKERYLDSLEHPPGEYFPSPYKHLLDNMITKAIREVGTRFYEGVQFDLYNRWEAEYIEEQMAKRCPNIKYRMKWHFGGPMEDDGDAEQETRADTDAPSA